MPPVGFEPVISGGERYLINALDLGATGTGQMLELRLLCTAIEHVT